MEKEHNVTSLLSIIGNENQCVILNVDFLKPIHDYFVPIFASINFLGIVLLLLTIRRINIIDRYEIMPAIEAWCLTLVMHHMFLIFGVEHKYYRVFRELSFGLLVALMQETFVADRALLMISAIFLLVAQIRFFLGLQKTTLYNYLSESFMSLICVLIGCLMFIIFYYATDKGLWLCHNNSFYYYKVKVTSTFGQKIYSITNFAILLCFGIYVMFANKNLRPTLMWTATERRSTNQVGCYSKNFHTYHRTTPVGVRIGGSKNFDRKVTDEERQRTPLFRKTNKQTDNANKNVLFAEVDSPNIQFIQVDKELLKLTDYQSELYFYKFIRNCWICYVILWLMELTKSLACKECYSYQFFDTLEVGVFPWLYVPPFCYYSEIRGKVVLMGKLIYWTLKSIVYSFICRVWNPKSSITGSILSDFDTEAVTVKNSDSKTNLGGKLHITPFLQSESN